jgi:hypothetical protein
MTKTGRHAYKSLTLKEGGKGKLYTVVACPNHNLFFFYAII